ncbi:kinase-like domain-containing protein [Tuber borchii]|uniref:Kinase-like domain-containing protein n=1 Tax=Tuber borchii TaxID=42251 RepID=A0A2T6ZU63_TUBBO|nr:kinase-like domain-containing protein [Tuber borchii]
MDNLQSDLIVWYKLETEFLQNRVRHTKYLGKAKNRNKKVKEDWSNCGELGRGGFGVVHKQVESTTGSLRAVKTIDKRPPLVLDYSRELLVNAILAKRPSLFVEFLGWFEGPKTLYIAMEYLEEGDLSKHIGTPLPRETVQNISKQILEGLGVMHQQGIAHRDLKPANIFAVSMSPVWVKLGDFGVSKRILAQADTTLHTPVSTQAYSAPEVLGLDSNSETSDYTNSVDIWSLGCVIYELLVGTKLFPSEGQLCRYYFGKLPFPEDKLKGLSPPTDDIGISLLKSMLLIQPEDRPTAAAALNHAWLAGIHRDNEDSGQDQDEVTQSRDESTRSAKRKNSLSTHGRPKKRRSKRNQATLGDIRSIPGGVAFGAGAGSQGGGDLRTQNTVINTSVITRSRADTASAESLGAETGPRRSELMSHNSQITNSKGRYALRENNTRYIPQTGLQDLPQAAPERPTPTVEIVSNPPGSPMGQWNTRERKCTKSPPSPPPPPATELDRELPTSESTLPGRAGSNETIRRIRRTKPNTAATRMDRTINPMRNPNTWRNINRGRERNAKQTPSAGSNPNTGGSRNLGWNSNC